MVLYPTNALVEDQVVRLRKAIRRIGASSDRGKLWFGRYTGSTLGSATMPGKGDARVTDVAAQLQTMIREYEDLAAAGTSEDDLAQFADPRVGEMVTRWDMVVSPPDILVTNFSMLNAMLMREVERPMFDATASWLGASGRHVLTLVIDELHLYRGTPGSEIAMVIRNLLMRLGIGPDSPQLRIIGTSASLDSQGEGLQYLEEFFGVDRSSFSVVAWPHPGPRRATRAGPRSDYRRRSRNGAGSPRQLALTGRRPCLLGQGREALPRNETASDSRAAVRKRRGSGSSSGGAGDHRRRAA